MARQITQLAAAGALAGADLVWLEQSGVPKKATMTEVAAFTGGGSGALGDNANITTAGWYRIAENTAASGRGGATFYISNAGGGAAPGPAMFHVSVGYQANLSDAAITLIAKSSVESLQQIRLVLDTTAGELYVEVYIAGGAGATYTHTIIPDGTLGTWASVDYTAGATANFDLTWNLNASNVVNGVYFNATTPNYSFVDTDGALTLSSGIALIGTIDFDDVVGDKGLWYGAAGGAGSYATGVESNTLYHRAATYHRWYINSGADDGASDSMQLSATQLRLEVPISVGDAADSTVLTAVGGTGGADIARFQRDPGGGADTEVSISGSSGFPTITFDRDIGTAIWSVGESGTNQWVVADDANLATPANHRLIVTPSGVDVTGSFTASGALNTTTATPVNLGADTASLTAHSLYMDNKEALETSGTWLRLNDNNQFSSGTFIGNTLRVDGLLTLNAPLAMDGSAITGAGAIGATSLTTSGPIVNNGGMYTQDNGAGGRVFMPEGGYYFTGTNVHTGAIQIDLPAAAFGDNDMISFEVSVFDYTSNESFKILIAGYSQSGSLWNNESVQIIASNTNRDFDVRFGASSATRQTVWIGELASTWSYPQISITNFQAGYTTADVSIYADDWIIGFQATSFFSVDATIADNFPLADHAYTADTATVSSTSQTNASAINADYKVTFALTTGGTSGQYGVMMDSESTFTYNPSTNTLKLQDIELTGNLRLPTVSSALIMDTGTDTLTMDLSTNGQVNFTGTGGMSLWDMGALTMQSNGVRAENFQQITGTLQPWMTLAGSGTGNWTAQGSGISVGESGKKGSAAIHMTYNGDGSGYLGAGTVDNTGETGGRPAFGHFDFTYNATRILVGGRLFPGVAAANDTSALTAASVQSTAYIEDASSQNYGSINVTGIRGTSGTYSGISVNRRLVMMNNGGTTGGLYNDTSNQWILQYTEAAHVGLYYASVQEVRTQNSNAADMITGLGVHTYWDQTNYLPVGIGVIPHVNITTAQTLGETHMLRALRWTSGAANLAVTANNDAGMRVNCWGMVWNESGTNKRFTAGTGVTIYHFDGAGGITKTATQFLNIADGGNLTWTKISDTLYRTWGIGVTA